MLSEHRAQAIISAQDLHDARREELLGKFNHFEATIRSEWTCRNISLNNIYFTDRSTYDGFKIIGQPATKAGPILKVTKQCVSTIPIRYDALTAYK